MTNIEIIEAELRDAEVPMSDALALALGRLEDENAALRADAERYRWLRDMDEDPVSLAALWTDCLGSAISIRIDAAIDAARKEKP